MEQVIIIIIGRTVIASVTPSFTLYCDHQTDAMMVTTSHIYTNRLVGIWYVRTNHQGVFAPCTLGCLRVIFSAQTCDANVVVRLRLLHLVLSTLENVVIILHIIIIYIYTLGLGRRFEPSVRSKLL